MIKADDPYDGLPEHVQGLIGEVHVHLNNARKHDDADSETGEQAELEEVEKELKKQGHSSCFGLLG